MLDLYQLIHSLDPNEKKYFKRFGIRDESKGKSNTLKLFEVFEEAEVFDEEKILIRIKREKLDKQIASLKHYLSELLMDNLLWYHKDDIAGLDTALALAKMKLLEGRGLEEDAVKLLDKAVKDIDQRDAFVEKWNLLSKQIVTASNDFLASKKYGFNKIDELLHQRGEVMQQMQRSHEYEVLMIRQLRVMRKAMQARNENDVNELQEVFNSPLIQHKQEANSNEALFIYHTVRIHHYLLKGDMENFYAEALAMIQFIKTEGNTALGAMRTLWAYSQITQACYFTQRWAELEKYLNELQAAHTTTQTEQIAQFSYYTQLAITLLDFKGNISELQQLLSDTQAKLAEFDNKLRPDIRLAITITTVSALIEYGKYSAAIDVCENFLTNYDSGIRLDAMLMLYVYQVIAHLEESNMVYVHNTIQNIYRYFLRNDYNGVFESTLMKVLKKLSEIQEYTSHTHELEKLRAELTNSAGDAANRQHLALLPFLQSFIDAKLKGMQMHQYAANIKANQ